MAFTATPGTAFSKYGNVVPGYSGLLLVTAGLSAGSATNPVFLVTAGLTAGTFGTPEGQASTGIQVGSRVSDNLAIPAGVSVGSVATVPTQRAGVVSTGILVGSAAAGDSGDLANGRYRR